MTMFTGVWVGGESWVASCIRGNSPHLYYHRGRQPVITSSSPYSTYRSFTYKAQEYPGSANTGLINFENCRYNCVTKQSGTGKEYLNQLGLRACLHLRFFLKLSCSCDCFTISFLIGFNIHFIAK